MRASSSRIEPVWDARRPSFGSLRPVRDARIAGLEHERRHGAVELREDERELGDAAVRDVALLAVQDVLVALAARRRLDAGDVRAGARLGEGDRGEAALLGGEPRQPALPLLLARRRRGAAAPGTSSRRSAPRGPRSPRRAPPPTSVEVTADTPPPPYSAGIACEVSPSAAALASSSGGQSSRSSHSRAIGRSSRTANSCASSRSSRCSDESSKPIPVPAEIAI